MTNREAIGYMLCAAKEAGLTKEQVMKMRSSMYYMFDCKTEGEAEEQGHNWYYEEIDNE